MQQSPQELNAGIFAALAHPNRLRILEHLRGSPKCNCELAPLLGLEQSNLSRHLKLLEQAGVLTSRKEGLRVHYRVADERIFEMLDLAAGVAKRAALERLKAVEPESHTR